MSGHSDNPGLFIVLLILAAAMGCLYGWWWFNRWNESGTGEARERAMGTDKLPKRRPTTGERVFNVVVVAGVVSSILAITCWQIFSVGDPTTIFFAAVGVIGISAWPIFGGRF